MLLSICTGTYNRISYLQRMIESARAGWPRHLSMEFVVVDGGSTDGTLEWLVTQPDVRVIRHGALLGAIKAFCDGAKSAQGDYVVMANDDVVFHKYSILRALSYLEETPTCGAVAFADNRFAQVHKTEGYRVMQAPAIAVDGTDTMVNYAQVGMFRGWLGNLCGWWGSDDPIMGQARTYGGDNYLSSRVWECGYTVDAVEGCSVDDLIPRDDLRSKNSANGDKDSYLYYQRFPRGAQLKDMPTANNPQEERLRVLLMDIHEPALPAKYAKEKGLADALAKIGLCWEIDYINEPWDLPTAVRAWQPHLLLAQIHDAQHITESIMIAARNEKPDMAVVSWNGDAHEGGLISPEIMAILRHVDLQTVVNTKVVPVYDENSIRSAYWQIGIKEPAQPFAGPVPEWDALFLGNCYNGERYELVKAMQSIKGLRVGIYGNCPGKAGNTHYDFSLSAALYQHCKIAISDVFPDTEGFVSNRLFQAMASGAFVLQQHSPRLDELTGLQAGVHYIEWKSLKDLKTKIRKWASDERKAERQKIAEFGREFVRENFSYDAQVQKLLEML
jgi:glycosyltransferase involved in cell wall biosynthesis